MVNTDGTPSNQVEALPYDEREEDYQEFDEYDEVTKPTAQPFYKRKKYWIFCAILTVIIVAVAVPIALFVILPKVAQTIINHSNMEFSNIAITNPTNTSLTMSMEGKLTNTGPFPATVKFPNPIEVYYNDQKIGSMGLSDTKASGGSGTISDSQVFTIADENLFAEFSKDMLSKENFVWTLKSTVEIEALGRKVQNLNLNKDLTLLGMNGFPQVTILKFDLPSDAAPGQGINLAIDTAMNNPSPIGITLGTIVLDISYQGVHLGQVHADGASLNGMSQSVLNLTGTMVPQNDTASLDIVSNLFSNYIAGLSSNTTAKGVSVLPDGVNKVGWLSTGLEALVLNVALQSPTPLNIITSIALGPMGMNWTGTDFYAPLANSPQVTAGFQMPFGFTLNVTEVQNNMTVIYQNKTLANVNAADWGPAETVKNNGSSFINFALPPTPFAIVADGHSDFDAFVTKLSTTSGEGFTVSGFAGTVANTPIGVVKITGIPFKSDVSLSGLQGLTTSPTLINKLTVTGGIPAGLQIALDLTMTNPSDLTIVTGPGDNGIVSFGMVYEGDNVGTVIFPTLTLTPGVNNQTAGALFTPSGTAGGQALLQKYMTNQVATVDIYGSTGSSAITPLAAGLSQIHLQSDMPGNPAQLLLSTSLTILNDTGVTGIAMASVTVNNPFIPPLTIKSIKSTVNYKGAALGTIDIADTTISVPGMSQAASQPLPLTMNLAIDSLLGLIIAQAQVNNMDPTPIVELGKMAKDPTYKASSAVFAGFNLPNFVIGAMKNLKVDVEMSVNVLVGEYATSLTLTQNQVPTATDESILLLLPIVGTPIAQAIVDQAIMTFSTVSINNPAETAFTTNINGKIENTGPFDAVISFPLGSAVSWSFNGAVSQIGQISMPNVPTTADVGATLALTNVPFSVTSGDNMGKFVSYSLSAESFDWVIEAHEVVVIAMGAPIPHINLTKNVTLKGFNGLKGLEIQSFDLPSNDPNGIHLVLNATLPNPSNVGIELGAVTFANIYNGQDLGTVSTVGLTLIPNTVTPIAMAGTLVKQTSEAGLAALGDLFRVTLAGGTPSLVVKGQSVTPPSGPVSWLSAAFADLTMNVTLPSIGKVDMITGITLKNMTLDFTGPDPYVLSTSSDNIEATFHIPFAFPLNVVQVAEDMSIQLPQGNTVANLKLPMGPATTLSPGVLRTGYTNQPLSVVSSQHELFNKFSQILTVGPGVSFFLAGTVDTVADTAAGQVTIPGVQVAVGSTMVGMNLNAGGASITNISVAGGTADYLEIHQNVVLTNPSGLTVKVGDVGFNIGFHGIPMGVAVVSNMVLAPGTNTLPAVFKLAPPSAQVRDAFLSGFVAGASFDLTVAGSASSTTIPSLQLAMASVSMGTSIKGITDRLIADGSRAQPDILEMLQMTHPRVTPVQVNVFNPFDTDLYISHMTAKNYWKGDTFFGDVDQDVSVTIPAKGTVPVPVNMVSPAGLGFALSPLAGFILANPTLLTGANTPVSFTINATITAKVGGPNGYLGNVQYTQPNTIINLQIGGDPLVAQQAVHQFIASASGSASAPAPTNSSSSSDPSATGSPSSSPSDTSSPSASSSPSGTSPSTPTITSAPVRKRQDSTVSAIPTDPNQVQEWFINELKKAAAAEGVAWPNA